MRSDSSGTTGPGTGTDTGSETGTGFYSGGGTDGDYDASPRTGGTGGMARAVNPDTVDALRLVGTTGPGTGTAHRQPDWDPASATTTTATAATTTATERMTATRSGFASASLGANKQA
jgi:hypothetical protein